MVHQDILAANQVEHIRTGRERGRRTGNQRFVLERAESIQPMQRQEDREIHRSAKPVDVPVVQIEGPDQHLHKPLVGGIGDLEPHRVAVQALAEVFFDGLEQIFSVVLIDREIGVAGHPEYGMAEHAKATEQRT